MSYQFTFRHVDSSPSLCEYTEAQLDRVGFFLPEESRWQIHYSKGGRNECQVTITVSGRGAHFKASCQDDDFYSAVDDVADKLSRQFQKHKDMIQNHKMPELSREGHLQNLNESLEYVPLLPVPAKRSA